MHRDSRRGGTLDERLLGAGLAFSTATQLRVPDLPIGVGEVLLLLVAGLSALNIALSRRIRLATAGALMALGWGLLATALLAGWLVGLFLGSWNVALGTYDAIAYAFSIVIIISFISLPDTATRIEHAMKIMSVVASVGLSVLLVVSVLRGRDAIAFLSPWFGIRFVGWSTNPNQLALIVGALPFIALHFRQSAPNRRQRFMATFALCSSVLLGIATLSDALFVGWLAGIAGIVLIWALGTERPALLSHNVLAKFLLLTVLLAITAIAFFDVMQARIMDRLIAEQGQASIRILLWQHGLQAFLESPLVGHGPGAYSWVTDRGESFEAHNTYIDIAASAGLIGLAALTLLMGSAVLRAFRARASGLFGCIVYLAVFTSFHFMARHPLFWFLVLFVLLASKRAEPVPESDDAARSI